MAPQETPGDSNHPQVPRHVAIVMDGNGRWARNQGKPRQAGHQAGAQAARSVVEESVRLGVDVLTLFAFSSENWSRPEQETSFLMDLFFRTLSQEADRLAERGVALRVIGDRQSLPAKLCRRIEDAESGAPEDPRLMLQVALSYGGRWDIARAARQLAVRAAKTDISADSIDERAVSRELSFSDLPDVDLFIRTGGELRLSNFILWQAAYAELYFTPILWPDFDQRAYRTAIEDYASRQRRFGLTGDQVTPGKVNG